MWEGFLCAVVEHRPLSNTGVNPTRIFAPETAVCAAAFLCAHPPFARGRAAWAEHQAARPFPFPLSPRAGGNAMCQGGAPLRAHPGTWRPPRHAPFPSRARPFSLSASCPLRRAELPRHRGDGLRSGKARNRCLSPRAPSSQPAELARPWLARCGGALRETLPYPIGRTGDARASDGGRVPAAHRRVGDVACWRVLDDPPLAVLGAPTPRQTPPAAVAPRHRPYLT